MYGAGTYLQLLGAATASRMPADAFADMIRDAPDDDTIATGSGEGPGVHEDVDTGAFEVAAMTMRHHEWLKVNEERALLRLEWARFFGEFDLVVMPIGPVPAFEHDHSVADPPYWRQSGRRVSLDVSSDRAAELSAANRDPALAAGLAESAGPTLPFERQVFWAGLPTVCHLPATAVPIAAAGADGLPVAFQIVG